MEMKVKYSRFHHNAKQTSFTSQKGPRRQGDEQEQAQYRTNHDVTSVLSCRRPENVSILSPLILLSGKTNRSGRLKSFRSVLYMLRNGNVTPWLCDLLTIVWYVFTFMPSKTKIKKPFNLGNERRKIDKTLAKIQVGAIFHMLAIRRNVLPKFIEFVWRRHVGSL